MNKTCCTSEDHSFIAFVVVYKIEFSLIAVAHAQKISDAAIKLFVLQLKNANLRRNSDLMKRNIDFMQS